MSVCHCSWPDSQDRLVRTHTTRLFYCCWQFSAENLSSLGEGTHLCWGLRGSTSREGRCVKISALLGFTSQGRAQAQWSPGLCLPCTAQDWIAVIAGACLCFLLQVSPVKWDSWNRDLFITRRSVSVWGLIKMFFMKSWSIFRSTSS